MTLLWTERMLGRDSTPGFSYPIFPWICFPLAGFILGVLAQRFRSQLEARFRRITAFLVGSAALCFGAAGLLIANDYPPNRWGTMSISYFCISAGVLALSILFALAALRLSILVPAARLLSLRGIGSLAVVLLHFVFVALFGVTLGRISSETAYLSACALFVVIVFTASRFVAAAGDRLASISRSSALWLAIVTTSASAGMLLAVLPSASYLTRVSIACAGQLCLCLLLVVRLPGRAADRAV